MKTEKAKKSKNVQILKIPEGYIGVMPRPGDESKKQFNKIKSRNVEKARELGIYPHSLEDREFQKELEHIIGPAPLMGEMAKKDKKTRKQAAALQNMGPEEDSVLVHMRPSDLFSVAQYLGMSINDKTGLPALIGQVQDQGQMATYRNRPVVEAQDISPNGEVYSIQRANNLPTRWQSSPNHAPTHLAYITDAEARLLGTADMHDSGIAAGKSNYGPGGIPSFNGMSGDREGHAGGPGAGRGDISRGDPRGDRGDTRGDRGGMDGGRASSIGRATTKGFGVAGFGPKGREALAGRSGLGGAIKGGLIGLATGDPFAALAGALVGYGIDKWGNRIGTGIAGLTGGSAGYRGEMRSGDRGPGRGPEDEIKQGEQLPKVVPQPPIVPPQLPWSTFSGPFSPVGWQGYTDPRPFAPVQPGITGLYGGLDPAMMYGMR